MCSNPCKWYVLKLINPGSEDGTMDSYLSVLVFIVLSYFVCKLLLLGNSMLFQQTRAYEHQGTMPADWSSFLVSWVKLLDILVKVFLLTLWEAKEERNMLLHSCTSADADFALHKLWYFSLMCAHCATTWTNSCWGDTGTFLHISFYVSQTPGYADSYWLCAPAGWHQSLHQNKGCWYFFHVNSIWCSVEAVILQHCSPNL